jgi:hypothetical protein
MALDAAPVRAVLRPLPAEPSDGQCVRHSCGVRHARLRTSASARCTVARDSEGDRLRLSRTERRRKDDGHSRPSWGSSSRRLATRRCWGLDTRRDGAAIRRAVARSSNTPASTSACPRTTISSSTGARGMCRVASGRSASASCSTRFGLWERGTIPSDGGAAG